MTCYLIESAVDGDLDAIMGIERASFEHPWQRESMVAELHNEIARFLVCREPNRGRVVGFINYWLVADEVHLLNVATHPRWRRQGLARLMMDHCLDHGQRRDASVVTLEARRSNESAKQLYRGLGFRQVGVRKKYYDNQEDALLFELRISPDPEDPKCPPPGCGGGRRARP